MARLARVVVPGIPHHITQRGNRRQQTFFGEEDFALYLRLLSRWSSKFGTEVWAYCLMPNHVHLILIPSFLGGLCRSVGETHRRYTAQINSREGWRGHLWQGRFSSYPMDERHLLAAARYVELNPVRAGIVVRAEDYPWSSARAHICGRDDAVVKARPLLERMPDWGDFLRGEVDASEASRMRNHENTGRPMGDEGFSRRLETILGRSLLRQKPGPRPRIAESSQVSL